MSVVAFPQIGRVNATVGASVLFRRSRVRHPEPVLPEMVGCSGEGCGRPLSGRSSDLVTFCMSHPKSVRARLQQQLLQQCLGVQNGATQTGLTQWTLFVQSG